MQSSTIIKYLNHYAEKGLSFFFSVINADICKFLLIYVFEKMNYLGQFSFSALYAES